MKRGRTGRRECSAPELHLNAVLSARGGVSAGPARKAAKASRAKSEGLNRIRIQVVAMIVGELRLVYVTVEPMQIASTVPH